MVQDFFTSILAWSLDFIETFSFIFPYCVHASCPDAELPCTFAHLVYPFPHSIRNPSIIPYVSPISDDCTTKRIWCHVSRSYTVNSPRPFLRRVSMSSLCKASQQHIDDIYAL